MKKAIASVSAVAGVSILLVGFASTVSAQTACEDLGYTVSEENEAECQEVYSSCQANMYQRDVAGYNNCIDITTGGCNAIGRKADLFDDNCPISANFELDVSASMFQPGEAFYEGNLAFCECVVECKEQFITVRNCDAELDSCCAETAEEAPAEISVIIYRIRGDVEVDIGKTGYKPAKEGMVLHEGDYVSTGFDSSAVLKIPNIAILDVGEMTSFAISQLAVEGNVAKTMLSLRAGEVKSAISPRGGRRASFEISTPTSTVAVRGTEFYTSYDDENMLTRVYVIDGEVDVSDKDRGHNIVLERDQYVTVGEDGDTSGAMEGTPSWYNDLSQEGAVDSGDGNSWISLLLAGAGLLILAIAILLFTYRRKSRSK